MPPGIDTSAPGFSQGLAARERISSGDWRGCLAALEGAPSTLDNLWLRASCAFQARDRAALQRTCDTIGERFPDAPQNRGCQGMLTAM